MNSLITYLKEKGIHRGNLIVVYFGRNGNAKTTLSNVLGPRLV